MAAAALDDALVFVGFMGAGKTTAAGAAAAALGSRAVDADAVIEARLGTSIADHIAASGEPAFRAVEEEVVCGLLDAPPGPVLALGGGAVGSARVRAALARHVTVLVDVTPEVAWQRVGGRRPLAQDRTRFEALHASRAAVYEAVADAVLPASAPAVVRAALPALAALRDAPEGTRLLWARTASGDYPVFVGEGVLAGAASPRDPVGAAPPDPAPPPYDLVPRPHDLVAHPHSDLIRAAVPALAGGRPFLVTDAAVGPLYADRLGAVAADLRVPPGEGAKTWEEAGRLLRALAAAGMAHDDHVLALGGGVVGDLAGFCASAYQRGVPVVQLPTTLVAQVDSAYGGKTGVDLPEGKNYAGAYHQPAAVLADPSALATLPPEELAAGWAEVVKTALIAGGPLWERVRGGEAEADRDLVLACARTKLAVVAQDERDAGRRQALNLGHTVGHAVETVTGYARYRHGEAVALGLLAALTLSGLPDLRAEVADLLAARGLPTRLDPGIDIHAVLVAMQRDKKRRGGQIGFVLVEAPGSVMTGQALPEGAVASALEELRAP